MRFARQRDGHTSEASERNSERRDTKERFCQVHRSAR
jgi:hypothetical protein